VPSDDPGHARAVTDDTLTRIAGTLEGLAVDMRRSADANIAYRDAAADRALRITQLVRELEELKRSAHRTTAALTSARAEVARLQTKVGILTDRVTRLRSKLAAERGVAASLRKRRLVRWSMRVDGALRRVARRFRRP